MEYYYTLKMSLSCHTTFRAASQYLHVTERYPTGWRLTTVFSRLGMSFCTRYQVFYNWALVEHQGNIVMVVKFLVTSARFSPAMLNEQQGRKKNNCVCEQFQEV